MVMINEGADVSVKLKSLRDAIDKMAHDFQTQEVAVQKTKEALGAAIAGSKQKESEMAQKQREIEKLKEEKRELDRTATRLTAELQKAENVLAATKREHDRHHQELDRFQQEYARSQQTARSNSFKK